MLASNHRLRKAYEISRVYKKGAYGGSGGVISLKAASNGRSYSRVVVVVGKKVDKRAVVRNRIRRRLAEELRARWATVRAGYDIVISVHSDMSTLPVPQLRSHLTRALDRAGVIAS